MVIIYNTAGTELGRGIIAAIVNSPAAAVAECELAEAGVVCVGCDQSCRPGLESLGGVVAPAGRGHKSDHDGEQDEFQSVLVHR